MHNGLTFRFEAKDVKELVEKLDSSKGDHLWATFFLELAKVVQGNGSQKLETVMRAKLESFEGDESNSPLGSRIGCPVPPCTFVGIVEGCEELVQQILNDKDK